MARLNYVKIHFHTLVPSVSLSPLLFTFSQYNKLPHCNFKCFTFLQLMLRSRDNMKIWQGCRHFQSHAEKSFLVNVCFFTSFKKIRPFKFSQATSNDGPRYEPHLARGPWLWHLWHRLRFMIDGRGWMQSGMTLSEDLIFNMKNKIDIPKMQDILKGLFKFATATDVYVDVDISHSEWKGVLAIFFFFMLVGIEFIFGSYIIL